MDVTCDLCGSSNFYKEQGFYYCSECQRQTQDIQEQILDETTNFKPVKLLKNVRTSKPRSKAVERLTSWECYNYILLGLVNELLELGADERLKGTVQALWLKYLKVLEVIGKPNQPPKLSAVNSAVDAEIIYGRKLLKKPKSRSVSPSSISDANTTLDGQSMKRERTRHKKALVQAEYDDYLNSTQQSNTSLINQSLGSLQGNLNTIKNVDKYLHYNRSSAIQLKKVMKKSHLKRHRKDVHSTLKCHKLKYRMFKSGFLHGPEVLSRHRLYAIIYLGLLINKDKIQLGDLLRFVREGHISYEHVLHFFPEDYNKETLNIQSFSAGTTQFTHYTLRLLATKMAKLLKVRKYIPAQNIVDLCRRYCKELNLPDEICNYVMTLCSKTLPKMYFSSTSKIIPNYESRIVSFIIFSLKLFFGLDGATEFCMSDLASKINTNLFGQGSIFNLKMFDLIDWLKYIEYRKLILTQTYFPIDYVRNGTDNSHIFVNFINDYNDKCNEDKEATVQTQVVKNLLETITNSWGSCTTNINFIASLTPFYDYVLALLNSDYPSENYLTQILNSDFKDTSLDYLMRAKAYLEALNPDIKTEYKHGGANDDIELNKVVNKDTLRMRRNRHDKHKYNVTITDEEKQTGVPSNSQDPQERYSEIKVKSFETEHSKTFRTNEIYAENYCKNLFKDIQQNLLNVTESDLNLTRKIYNPAERFWLHSNDVYSKSSKEFVTFISKLPHSFRLILKECARMTEQTEQDVFEEYNSVELYLCYADDYRAAKVCDLELRKLIEKSINLW